MHISHYNLFYINQKGNRVDVKLSYHAMLRFKQRWYRLKKKKMTDDVAIEKIALMFSVSRRIPCTGQYRLRSDKHNGTSVYFRNSEFTFVVKNAVIVTIEISGKDMRQLN